MIINLKHVYAKTKLVAFAFFVLTICSCVDHKFAKDNIDNSLNYNPKGELNLPLVSTNLSLEKMMDKIMGEGNEFGDLLKTKNDGSLYLEYKPDLEGGKIDISLGDVTDEISNIKATAKTSLTTFSDNPSGPEGTICPTFNILQAFNFFFGDNSGDDFDIDPKYIERLDTILLSDSPVNQLKVNVSVKGFSKFDATSDEASRKNGGNMTLSLPEWIQLYDKSTGEYYFLKDKIYRIAGQTSGDNAAVIEISLAKAKILPNKKRELISGSKPEGNFTGKVELFNIEAGDLKFTADHLKADIDVSLVANSFQYAKGSFRPYDVEFSPGIKFQTQTISIDGIGNLFQNDDDVVSIKGGKINIYAENNIGIAIETKMKIKAYDSKGEKPIKTFDEKTFTMNRVQNVGQGAKSSSQLLLTSEEVNSILNNKLDQIEFTYSVSTLGIKSGEDLQFITSSPQLYFNYDVYIPLCFGSETKIGYGMTIEDIIGGDISNIIPKGDDAYVDIKILYKNMLPLALDLNFVVIDEAGNQILKIPHKDKIKAAIIGNNQTAETASLGEIIYSLKGKDLEKFSKGKSIRIDAEIRGAEKDANVRKNDFLEIYLEGHINGQIELTGN